MPLALVFQSKTKFESKHKGSNLPEEMGVYGGEMSCKGYIHKDIENGLATALAVRS